MKRLLFLAEEDNERVRYLDAIIDAHYDVERADSVEAALSILVDDEKQLSAVIVDSISSVGDVDKLIAFIEEANTFLFSIPILVLTDSDSSNKDEEYLCDTVIATIQKGQSERCVLQKIEKSINIINSATFQDFSEMLKALPSLVYLKDSKGRYVFCSKYLHHLEHADEPDWTIRGKTDLEIRKDQDNAKAAYESDLKLLEDGIGTAYVIEENQDGLHEFLQIIKEPVRNDDDSIRGIIAIINDVTEQEELKKELKRRSVTDELTGLYNRSYLDEYLRSLDDDSYPVSIISSDCDDLKIVNDLYGHVMGDEYIRMTAALLKNHLPEGSPSFRVGGDEFISVLPNTGLGEAKDRIEEMKNTEEWFTIKGKPLSVSMGAWTIPGPDVAIEEGIKKSDAEMYKVKKEKKQEQRRRNRVHLNLNKYEFNDVTNSILEKMPVPFVVYQTIKGRIDASVISDGFLKLFGISRKEAFDILYTDVFGLTHPDDRARLANQVHAFARYDEDFDIVYRSLRVDSNEYFIVHGYGEHIQADDGSRLGIVWYADEGAYHEHSVAKLPGDEKEGTALKEDGGFKTVLNNILHSWVHRAESMHENYYDKLTGLMNLNYFLLIAEEFKYNTINEGGSPVMLFFDLKGMKAFNEEYGFSEGDKVLQGFANILKKHFSTYRCGRYGADHFVACVNDNGETTEILDEIFEDIKGLNNGRSLPVSVGIYENSFEDVSAKVACDRAKIACDHEKDNYNSHYAYFSQEIHADWHGKVYVLNNIDRAIKEGWIQSYYQPIVRSVTGRVCSEEALCRWIDPENGMLSPAEFIPVLEESGLLYKLDLCMVENIIKDFQKKIDAGMKPVPVSVNLSWSDFQSCDMVSEISSRLDAAGISHDMINIEITETVIGKNPDYMRRQIDRFHEKGFSVWMDDFGSGYSSLDILQHFDFDLIKFNMQFMKDFDASDKSKVLMTELTQMALKLGIDTLTEGVETMEQVRFLREIGCDKIQGFFYCRPKSLDEVIGRHNSGEAIQRENAEEMDYYDIICKASLRDPSANNIGQSKVYNYFSTVPIGIFEVREDGYYVIRYNKTCGDFVEKITGHELDPITRQNTFLRVEPSESFAAMLDECAAKDDWEYYENIKLKDGINTLKAFVKKLAVNPVTRSAAVMVIVMSIIKEQ